MCIGPEVNILFSECREWKVKLLCHCATESLTLSHEYYDSFELRPAWHVFCVMSLVVLWGCSLISFDKMSLSSPACRYRMWVAGDAQSTHAWKMHVYKVNLTHGGPGEETRGMRRLSPHTVNEGSASPTWQPLHHLWRPFRELNIILLHLRLQLGQARCGDAKSSP